MNNPINPNNDSAKTNEFFVYLLECTDKSTYVGATVDLDHRLRQHNKEIKGGAVATSKKVVHGHTWNRLCYIRGFPDWQSALQFEWAFKYYSRKFAKKMYPLQRRMRGLYTIMNMEKPTSKAIPYYQYNNGFDEENGIPGPKIVWESDEAKNIYNAL
jgi:structure-specific endonuclease subunit SLX1